MGCKKRKILVVDRNRELLDGLNSAFLHSGYEVRVTDRVADVVEIVSSADRSAAGFDLIIVDISGKRDLGLMTELQNINCRMPVFALKDVPDKAMLIDLLNQKRVEFIERFIESYKNA